MDGIQTQLPVIQGPSHSPHKEMACAPVLLMVCYFLGKAHLTGSLLGSRDSLRLTCTLQPPTALFPPALVEFFVALQSSAEAQLLSEAFSDVLMGWNRWHSYPCTQSMSLFLSSQP